MRIKTRRLPVTVKLYYFLNSYHSNKNDYHMTHTALQSLSLQNH